MMNASTRSELNLFIFSRLTLYFILANVTLKHWTKHLRKSNDVESELAHVGELKWHFKINFVSKMQYAYSRTYLQGWRQGWRRWLEAALETGVINTAQQTLLL